MTIQQILTFLSAKGLLHEDEAFTIAGGEEAASISLTLPHLLILKDVTEEEKAILSSRLSMLYEPQSKSKGACAVHTVSARGDDGYAAGTRRLPLGSRAGS